MKRDFVKDYQNLLEITIFGARVRGFFFGKHSDRLVRYLEVQQAKLWNIKEDAGNQGIPIQNRRNLDLGARLLGIRAEAIYGNVFI